MAKVVDARLAAVLAALAMVVLVVCLILGSRQSVQAEPGSRFSGQSTNTRDLSDAYREAERSLRGR